MTSTRAWRGFAALVGGMMVLMSCTQRSDDSSDALTQVGRALPAQIGAWQAATELSFYTPDTLFDYIDGHAELYRAYGLEASLARRYSGPEAEGDIVVDVFRLASAADAYGVFTHDQDGDEIDIGQGALFRYGWLSFWKGPFFVSIYAEGESPEATAAVHELGRVAAAAITEEGSMPVLVRQLPAAGLEPRTRRYLHHPTILAAHRPIGGHEQLLELDTPGAAAALGRYERDGEQAHLLLVSYPERTVADTAAAAFAAAFLDPDRQPAEHADGWYAVAVTADDSRQLGFVLGADSKALATSLLAEAGAPDDKEPAS